MERKVKAVFVSEIPASEVTEKGVEYYVEASDGDNVALCPPSSPGSALSISTYTPTAMKELLKPTIVESKNQKLTWKTAGKSVFWYRIYRSNKPDFKASPANFVTYIAAGTTEFKDNGEGFDGAALKGDWYYRITAVDRSGNESLPSKDVRVTFSQ